MGCAGALHAAVTAPERISHLILANPPTAWERRSVQAQRHERAVNLLQRRGVEAFLLANRRFPAFPAWLRADHPELEPARLDELARFDATRLVPVLMAAAQSDLPSPERLSGLAIPTLVLAWSDDPAHPLETAERLAALIPGAELMIARDTRAVERWPELIDAFVSA